MASSSAETRYLQITGGCDDGNQDKVAELEQQILAVWQTMNEHPSSPYRSEDNATNSEFESGRNGVIYFRDHLGRRTRITRVSDRWCQLAPVRDVVLKPSGLKGLSSEDEITILKFTNFMRRNGTTFVDGRYTCASTHGRDRGVLINIEGDRPCPIYSPDTPSRRLKGTVIADLGMINRSSGRYLIHLDKDQGTLPEYARSTIVYAGCDEFVEGSASSHNETYLCWNKSLSSHSVLITCLEPLGNTAWVHFCVRGDEEYILRPSDDSVDSPCCDQPRYAVEISDRECLNDGWFTHAGIDEAALKAQRDEARDHIGNVQKVLHSYLGKLNIGTLSNIARVPREASTNALAFAASIYEMRARTVCYAGGQSDTRNDNFLSLTDFCYDTPPFFQHLEQLSDIVRASEDRPDFRTFRPFQAHSPRFSRFTRVYNGHIVAKQRTNTKELINNWQTMNKRFRKRKWVGRCPAIPSSMFKFPVESQCCPSHISRTSSTQSCAAQGLLDVVNTLLNGWIPDFCVPPPLNRIAVVVLVDTKAKKGSRTLSHRQLSSSHYQDFHSFPE